MTSTGTAIALISLVLAAVWCAARAIRSKTGLEQRLGQTTWDFAKSWASNLASAGSILGLVLGASKGLPQSNLALTATVLSILFGALVILGPISYYGLQVVQNGTLEGTVGGFVVASTLLLWAAFGELATAAAFVQDLADKLPAPIVWLFLAVALFAVLILLRYSWLSMGWVLKQVQAPPAPPSPNQPLAPRNLPGWNLM